MSWKEEIPKLTVRSVRARPHFQSSSRQPSLPRRAGLVPAENPKTNAYLTLAEDRALAAGRSISTAVEFDEKNLLAS